MLVVYLILHPNQTISFILLSFILEYKDTKELGKFMFYIPFIIFQSVTIRLKDFEKRILISNFTCKTFLFLLYLCLQEFACRQLSANLLTTVGKLADDCQQTCR